MRAYSLPNPIARLSVAALLVTLAAPASGQALRYAEDRAPGIVNPLFTTSMGEARLNELLFEGLYSDDLDLRSQPRLAESIQLGPGNESATVTLRSDVTWHDGKPLTADDVVFTVEAMKNPSTASPEAGRAAWIKKVRKIGTHQVEFIFERPEFAPQDKMHFKILPAHRFGGTTVDRSDPFRTMPVGTGPFMFERFNDDNSISLAAYPAYHTESHLDGVVMREVADKNYQAKLLLYESVEALVRVLSRDLAALQNDRNVELYPYQTNSWWYFGYNLRRAPFDDPRVREAVLLMLDVDALLAPIGTGDRVTGPFVPSSPYYNHDIDLSMPSNGRAAELLTEAGYAMSGRQWTRDGQPLTVRIASQKNLETALDVVVNAQSQLQNQGVVVEAEFLETAEWRSRVWANHDFDMVLSMWSFDRNEDVYEQFHSSGVRNFVGYNNPEVDRLLDEARQAVDPQEKKALMRQVHATVTADKPMVFLWTLDSYSALSAKVENVVVHPFYYFTWARDWFLGG